MTYNTTTPQQEADNIEAFAKLTINPPVKWLYVDALNYGGRFFPRKGSHWQVEEAVKKIQKFIDAARRSGWELKVFIDAATKSSEALKKWRTRREAEVQKEVRDVPQAMNTLLGDAFQDNGVEVLYSLEADNDDTLAAYAHRDNAAILSGDRDFFRYRGLDVPIYGEFEIRKKYLHLFDLQWKDKVEMISKRDILSPLPKVITKDPALVDLALNIYRRGAPTPLVKRLGNPHLTIRPLRRALYSRKNVNGAVREIFPVWDVDRCAWVEEDITPDSALDHLLDNPREALETFFPKDSLIKPPGVNTRDWQNHLYAIHCIIYELCALGNKNGDSLLKMFLPAVVEFKKSLVLEGMKAQKEKKPKNGGSNSKGVNPGKAVYEFICRYCQLSVHLYKGEVVYLQEKGFQMPKQCKDCKKSRQEKEQGGYKKKAVYYNQRNY